MQDRILEYASFSESQKSEIERSVDAFFLWHRTNEVPRYAEYIAAISNEIESNQFDQTSILEHLKNIRKLSEESFQQSPIAKAAPFLKALTDQQVAEVAMHMKKKDEDFNEWYSERQQSSDDEERVQKIVKNIGRLGIKLNREQADRIKVGLNNYRGGPEERFAVWNKWEEELLDLLRNRLNDDFENRVSLHLAQYQDQMRLHSPENHEHNQINTARLINDLLRSLTLEQKATLLKKLRQTQKSLYTIASR